MSSGVYQALSWAATLVVFNICFVLVGIPIVTVGAGLVGVLAGCMSLIGGDSSTRTFFTAVRRSFGPATVASLADVVIGSLIAWEWVVAGQLASQPVSRVVRALLVGAGCVLAVVNVWFWPLLAARVQRGVTTGVRDLPDVAKAALLAGLRYLPRSLIGCLIAGLPLGLASVSPASGARVVVVMGVIGVAFCCYLICLVLRRWVIVESEE